MECFAKTLETDSGEILLHFIRYPNNSMFVWVSRACSPEFDEFHVASPTMFSDVPAVSTRLGDAESRGRSVALRISKRIRVPVIVSWSIPEEYSAVFGLVEAEIFANLSSSRSPSVVGA